MTIQFLEVIKKAYSAFNEPKIDNALLTMHADVKWSKAWEGGKCKTYLHISRRTNKNDGH